MNAPDPRLIGAALLMVGGGLALRSGRVRAAIAPGLSDLSADALPVPSDGAGFVWPDVVQSVIEQGAAAVATLGNPEHMSEAGIQMLAGIESFSATPYRDAGGYSIGYGHFIKAGESFAVITRAQGADLLRADVAEAERAVSGGLFVRVTQQQFDALASLAYNIGGGAFAGSTLLRKLNAGDVAGAAAQFAVWNKSQGVTLAALQVRRDKEARLFSGGVYA